MQINFVKTNIYKSAFGFTKVIFTNVNTHDSVLKITLIKFIIYLINIYLN
jgi:hypothetical protein